MTRQEAEHILQSTYSTENYSRIIKVLLQDEYSEDVHMVAYGGNLFSSVKQIGEASGFDLTIYEVMLNGGMQNRRVAITQEMFKVLSDLGDNNALVALVNEDGDNYRISLLTNRCEFRGDDVVEVQSNPRRYSYSLGVGTKTRTAYETLISRGQVKSLDELISRFSVEAVNKLFYNEIALAFTKLVGGERNARQYKKVLQIDKKDIDSKTYSEFAVRLIGRLVFCWFLKEKKSDGGISLIPEEMFSDDKIKSSINYYNDVIEPLFFELLNTNQTERKIEYDSNEYRQIPYLNGGLFRPHDDDFYSTTGYESSGKHSLVTIPNDWFIDLFGLMRQYNFTVDEDTSYDVEMSIDPEMLGRIFENLLAEINPETGKDARNSTGSFYTPRDIVDFMVDSSITRYLEKATKISSERIEKLIDYSAVDYDLKFTEDEKKSLIDALYSVTILDPACGSGAFPIGMLQKIVYILQVIDPTAELWFDKAMEKPGHLIESEFKKKFNEGSLDYIRKLCIIQNSIFGIDIQPIAVEIARLRCFLSLIIEENVYDDEPNRGINPLPNLEFKFVISNSLIKLDSMDDLTRKVDSEGNRQVNMLENSDDLDKMAIIRENYFNANNYADKCNLTEQFSMLQEQMEGEIREKFSGIATKRYDQLSKWNPFDNQSTGWFDSTLMFGISDGFDIVIGNPPYIQLQKQMGDGTTTKFGDFYENGGYATFDGNGDLYCLFYEAGYNFLKSGGILTFITSNKWMRDNYGKNLRRFLANNTNPLYLIDFGGRKIFEAASVSVNILIFEKSNNEGMTYVCLANQANLPSLKNLSAFVRQARQNSNIVNYSSDSIWLVLSFAIEQHIKQKVDTYGKRLGDWDVRINSGVKTGRNGPRKGEIGIFIIPDAKKQELIATDPNAENIIKPVLRGAHIKRYGYAYSDSNGEEWLICTHNGNRRTGIPPVNIDDYPAIKQHLDTYYNLINNRTDHAISPYNLRPCAYIEDFSQKKLIYADILQSPHCYYDEEGYFYVEASAFILIGEKLVPLLLMLNSKVIFYIFKTYYAGGNLGEGDTRYKKSYLETLPLPYPSDEDCAIMDDFYKKRKSASEVEQKRIDKEIDEFILSKYSFDYDEIEFIKRHAGIE